MSLSNVEYSVLKKKGGLHNRGFLSLQDEVDIASETLPVLAIEADGQAFFQALVSENPFDNTFAMRDFEE